MLNKLPFCLKIYNPILMFCLLAVFNNLNAQTPVDSLPSQVRLTDCINFALNNQPLIQQSKIDEDITKQDIRIALSGWLPQINLDANLQHYLKLPVSAFPDLTNPSGPKQELATGLLNTSAALFSANQTIYSTDLFFSGKTARDLRKLSSQNTQVTKTDLVINVSKAFYDVLLTQQQLKVLNEDILRLEKNYSDAYNQYRDGLSEKTDYQRAIIALNNARTEKKTIEETTKIKYAILKQLMGSPMDKPLTIIFDSMAIEKDTDLDTLQNQNFDKRPEYQVLQTSLNLQHAKVNYYKWSFLPTITAFGDYNFNYQNDQFSQLYNKNFPNSLVGLKLSMPLFQGTSRWHNLRKAYLQYNRLNLDITNLKNQESTEYTQAMAVYKSNLAALRSAKDNITIARDIFNTVKFQYEKGVVTYLEVIVSETDLRTSQLNYLNTLFQVLSSKLDVSKALGNITVK